MQPIDLIVVGVCTAAIVWLGVRFSRQQANVRDYFLAGNRVTWWVLTASIVATETSTVTLISVPAYSFTGDFTFLQLVFGYLIGRVVVSFVLLPAYFRGTLLTAYQLLKDRFGHGIERLIASIFLATRSLSDGFRLFATALVLAAVFGTVPTATGMASVAMFGGRSEDALVVAAVVLIGLITLVYTLLGGMAAVIWTDFVQFVIYFVGSVITAVILLGEILGGWEEVVSTSRPLDKLRVFQFSLDVTRNYTFWAAVVGGAFLTGGTHGTDQLIVQRYLCSRSVVEARRALILSGVVVFVQFTVFLSIGTMLWVFYTVYAPEVQLPIGFDGQLQPDRIFPIFMMSHLPVGFRGLMVAAIVAAAMSTLSSSLNSCAASTIGDFYLPWTDWSRSDRHYLSAARFATVGWGLLQIGVALIAIKVSNRVVDEVLGIQSFTSGLILGVFLLGFRISNRPAAAGVGVTTGAIVLLTVWLLTPVSWQWYVLIGSVTTVAAGWWTDRVLQGRAEGMS